MATSFPVLCPQIPRRIGAGSAGCQQQKDSDWPRGISMKHFAAQATDHQHTKTPVQVQCRIQFRSNFYPAISRSFFSFSPPSFPFSQTRFRPPRLGLRPNVCRNCESTQDETKRDETSLSTISTTTTTRGPPSHDKGHIPLSLTIMTAPWPCPHMLQAS